MSAEQRDELFRSEQQFHALSPQDQQRIRDLHEQIESAPDRDMLRATMNRYCKWFETQPPFRRVKLLDKNEDVRKIAWQPSRNSWQTGPVQDIDLDDKNRRAWPPGWIVTPTEHGPDSSKAWPKVPIRESPSFRPTGNRRSSARISCGAGSRAVPTGQLPIADNEMARLLAGLSPDLRAKLEAKKPGEQIRIIADWLRETASHELDEQLADYFEKDDRSINSAIG